MKEQMNTLLAIILTLGSLPVFANDVAPEFKEIIDLFDNRMSYITTLRTDYSLKTKIMNSDNLKNFGYATTYHDIEKKNLGPLVEIPLFGYSSLNKHSLLFILCHELGHLMGGKYKTSIFSSFIQQNEDSADQYAVQACLPMFYSSDKKSYRKSILDAIEYIKDLNLGIDPKTLDKRTQRLMSHVDKI